MKRFSQTPSNLEDHIGYWLRCLSNFVSYSFAEKLEECFISVSQWVVLRTLYDKEEMTLNEVAQKVGIDKSAMSRMIERLVEKNLVNRTDSQTDKRFLNLSLTQKAKELVPTLASLADENDNKFFKILSNQKKKEFLTTIKHLLNENGWDHYMRGKDRID